MELTAIFCLPEWHCDHAWKALGATFSQIEEMIAVKLIKIRTLAKEIKYFKISEVLLAVTKN